MAWWIALLFANTVVVCISARRNEGPMEMILPAFAVGICAGIIIRSVLGSSKLFGDR